MIAGSQTIADDRRRSQTIAEDRTWFYHDLSITIAGSQAIAEVCYHMIADDGRTFCDLRSAIVCDHMETSLDFLLQQCPSNRSLLIFSVSVILESTVHFWFYGPSRKFQELL